MKKYFKCEQCGLIVNKIPGWKNNECPQGRYQHYFKELTNAGDDD